MWNARIVASLVAWHFTFRLSHFEISIILRSVNRTVVINCVGLTPELIGARTPAIAKFLAGGKLATIAPSLPAVTTTVQSTYLTGQPPTQHGIVGNGWYFRDECEVKFWKQSNHLVQSKKIWETAREMDPAFTCANSFWWYNMYSSVDYSVTPRPMYPADGRKLPDVYTHPPELRDELQKKFGTFPLFNFWGPAASIASTRWIASSAIELDQRFSPTLHLIYLPHLDYPLQKFGPAAPQIDAELADVDREVGRLIDYFQHKKCRVILLSEYGITAVNRPVHLNRVLREAGLLAVRDEVGHDMIDPGASAAFAVADHQVAHVYVNDPAKIGIVRQLLERTPGVGAVYVGNERGKIGLDHPRAGELVVLAAPDAWFTYYFWLDDHRAPDYARTVDIHRKPGYDPVELFLNPAISLPKLRIGWKVLKKKLGLRMLMNVISLDATLVKGSHGLPPPTPREGPMVISQSPGLLDRSHYDATEIHDLILAHLTQPG